MKEIPLTQGYVALVDDADFEWLSEFNWCINKSRKYRRAYRGIGEKKQYMHSLITGYAMTDHRDGNGLNNQRGNLRPATQTENMQNRKKQTNNTSGYKGVCWHKAGKKWEAQISVNGKGIHLGLSTDIITAALVYDRAARELHGEFAKLNFPEIDDYSMLPPMKGFS